MVTTDPRQPAKVLLALYRNKNRRRHSRGPRDWYWACYRAWNNHIRYWHLDIAYGVKNLWRWLPTIWLDRNWDQAYLWRMMLRKLELMLPAIQEHSAHGEHTEALERCIELLREILRRDACECELLTSGCGLKRARICWALKERMLLEFGELFARHSPSWWD